jgi:hypothetical protein
MVMICQLVKQNVALAPQNEPKRGRLIVSDTVETWWQLSDRDLLAAYADARKRFAEKKFARDTQRARLEWQRAKAFAAMDGGASGRRSAIDASEELARKGQEIREMTRDLDPLKVEVDVIVRLRGAHAAADAVLSRPLPFSEPGIFRSVRKQKPEDYPWRRRQRRKAAAAANRIGRSSQADSAMKSVTRRRRQRRARSR